MLLRVSLFTVLVVHIRIFHYIPRNEKYLRVRNIFASNVKAYRCKPKNEWGYKGDVGGGLRRYSIISVVLRVFAQFSKECADNAQRHFLPKKTILCYCRWDVPCTLMPPTPKAEFLDRLEDQCLRHIRKSAEQDTTIFKGYVTTVALGMLTKVWPKGSSPVCMHFKAFYFSLFIYFVGE